MIDWDTDAEEAEDIAHRREVAERMTGWNGSTRVWVAPVEPTPPVLPSPAVRDRLAAVRAACVKSYELNRIRGLST